MQESHVDVGEVSQIRKQAADASDFPSFSSCAVRIFPSAAAPNCIAFALVFRVDSRIIANMTIVYLFPLINLVVSVLAMAGFLGWYIRTRSNLYLWALYGTFCLSAAAAFNAFLVPIQGNAYYFAQMINVIGALVIQLLLVRHWRLLFPLILNTAHPTLTVKSEKLRRKSVFVSRMMFVMLPLITLVNIAGLALLVFNNNIGNALNYTAGGMNVGFMLALFMSTLQISVLVKHPSDPSTAVTLLRFWRTQYTMVFFAAFPVILWAYDFVMFPMVMWWTWYVVALWPESLLLPILYPNTTHSSPVSSDQNDVIKYFDVKYDKFVHGSQSV